MRLHRILLAFLIGLLATSPAWCDEEDDWVAGTPNLQLWKKLDATQIEIMERFLDFSRQLSGVTPYYNAKWRKLDFDAPSLEPVPEFLRRALPGAARVSIRAYVRDFTGEVKHFGKPSPGDVNGHPTALWSIDPRDRWIIWQRDGLTLRMRADARDQDGKRILSAPECSLAVARVLDRFLGGHAERKGSVVILLDTSSTMAGESMVKALNSVIWIARTAARQNTSDGPTTVEWAFLTFAGDEIRVQHPFTQDPELTGTYCGMLTPGGKSSRESLAKAVAYALAYLHTNARGSTGKVVIVGNGRGTAKGEKSIERLNRLLTRLRLRNDDRAPAAHYDRAPAAHYDRAPAAHYGQLANSSRLGAARESLDDLLGRLERTATASGKQARIHAVGVDPTADAAGLRLIAEAGGGRYLRGSTDAERAAAANQLTTPGLIAPPVAAPQGGGGVQAGGGEIPPQTRGSVTICSQMRNGQALDPADSFHQADRIYAIWQGPDVIPGSNSTAIWTRDGVEYARADQLLDSSGSTTYWVRNTAPGGHPAGAYRLDVVVHGRTVASKEFTIGSVPGGPIAGGGAHPGRDGMPPVDGPERPPVGEDVGDLDDPLFGDDERLDVLIYTQDGAEIVEMGELTAFNGTYYTLTTDYGMPRRVLAGDVISLLLDGIGEGVPPNAAAGSIVLRDGRIVRGEIVRFEGNEFTVSKPDGSTMKLSRDQVQAVAVRSVDGGDVPPGGLPRLPAPDESVPEDGSVSERVLIGAGAPGWISRK